MLLPDNQISPIRLSGSSLPDSGSAMAHQRLRAMWPHDTCATAPGVSAATRTTSPLSNFPRSRWASVGMSAGAVVETNRVASAMPYDGLIAVGGSPYGANAALNVSMARMLTGSEPRMTTT